MTTQFPTALDDFTNPASSDKLNNPSHSAQHSNANDAIEAIQAYLGIATSTDPATITGRVAALEAGGGGGGSVAWGDITGNLVDQTDLQTALNSKVSLTGAQDIAGVKSFLDAARFKTAVYFDSVNGVEFGLIDMLDDANSSTGKVMVVESDAGVRIAGSYITLDSSNPRITMPGAQIGAPLVVAGVDSFGLVSLGYGAPLQSSYQITDTADTNVTIKAAGAAVPSAWVELGLGVVLAEAAAAGSATLAFEMVLQNNTTRTGTVEFGLRVNGTDLARDIVLQIPANFLQTVAMSIPLLNAYAIGDDVRLIARVTVQSNVAFLLNMLASASDPATMRFSVAGSTGGGSTNVSWGDINGTLSNQTDLQAALDGKLGVTAPAVSVDDLNSANALKQWVGTQAQYDAIVTKDPNTFYNITDGVSEADSVVDQGAGASLKFWYGTEAQYTAIATKDPATIYFRSA